MRKLFKILLYILSGLLLTAAAYVAYVFLTYTRIEDNLPVSTGGNAEKQAPADGEYTVVTYNLGYGAYTDDYTFFMDDGKESRARSKESVIDCITNCSDIALSFDPDFVLFQEVDKDATRSHHVDETQIINGIFGKNGDYDNVYASNYHSAYLMYPLTDPIGASESGLLTQSRFDITSSLRRSLPVSDGFNKILDLDRCYCISRIPVDDGKELVLVNLHMSAYGTNRELGDAQLIKIFGDLSAEYAKGNYVVCGGDFNHDFTKTSKEYFNPGTDLEFGWCEPFPDNVIPEGFSKCTGYEEGPFATTRYTNKPYGPDSFTVIVDGFIVSDNVSVNYVSNIDKGFKYSDHNPVVMRFSLVR
ncbi:MAG: endonuclease/exonuclease/phosphatase family protein [Lachnospiraceae bacterium]|nr:endonuclease/exonuclease/phosphatase family protein [Lachnospiraceae bacterium]